MRQFVGVLLRRKNDGAVLVQHRDNKPDILSPNTWCIPGGAREEDDEDLKATGVRELYEETNYLVNPDELQFLATDTYTNERGIQVERTIFWAPYDDIQQIHCNEGQEMSFIPQERLQDFDIYPGHKEFLNEATQIPREG